MAKMSDGAVAAFMAIYGLHGLGGDCGNDRHLRADRDDVRLHLIASTMSLQ
jgi:hypothetical protein